MDTEEEIEEAGTFQSVFYEYCHFLDEVFHLLNLDGIPIIDKYFARFCGWSHRKG